MGPEIIWDAPGVSVIPRSWPGSSLTGAWLAAALIFFQVTAPAPAGGSALEEAVRQFDTGQYRQAVATLRAAVAQNERDAQLHHWLARCYFELGEYDHAIASAERSVELDRSDSRFHQWLGRSYGRKAERSGWFSAISLAKKVRREFEEAVRLNPSNFSAQHDLIEFYFSAPGIVGGGGDKARKQAEALQVLDPGEGHQALGSFWLDKKKPDRAEAEFRLALAARPKRVDPYLEVADFYQKRGGGLQVEEAVEAAARVDPSDPRLDYYRGAARILAGNRLVEAEQLLKNYLNRVPQRSDFPSHAAAHEWLGRLYEREGRRDAAAEQYRAVLQLDPHSKSAREALRRIQR